MDGGQNGATQTQQDAQQQEQQAAQFNVTFEPGCRNFWHFHRATQDDGQMFVCADGRGYYQERNGKTIEMAPGTASGVAKRVFAAYATAYRRIDDL